MIFSDMAVGWGDKQIIRPLRRGKLLACHELKQMEVGGRTPMQTFIDGMDLARKANWDNEQKLTA